MFINPLLYVALILGIGCFFVGQALAARISRPCHRWVVGVFFAIASVPALSFVGYYAHLFSEPAWYVEARSLPGMELLSAGCGLLIGFVAPRRHGVHLYLLPLLLSSFAMGFVLVLTVVPFLKPIILPVEVHGSLQDQWQDDVCLQTSGATCGPASMATALTALGMSRTEREIARACYSCSSGTELWYLMRYARAQGCRVTYRHVVLLADVPAPAILGASVQADQQAKRSGHFVVLLERDGERYRIGDPLAGECWMTAEDFTEQYGQVKDALTIAQPSGEPEY